MKPFEIIPVNDMDVSCDGGGAALGHPRVYLHLESETQSVTCPYCSRQYVYHEGKRSA